MKFTKMLAAFLALCLALTCLPTTARASTMIEKGFLGDSVVWELHDDGTLYIYGSGDMPEYQTPWDAYQNEITTIVIDEGITSVSPSAFYYYENLTRVIIAGSVTTIGKGAFDHCTNLASVTLLPGVVTISDKAFLWCSSLKEITIPGSVTTIGESAFSACIALETVSLSEGLTSIGKNAFFCCEALTGITLPEGLVSLGEQAFYGCDAMTQLSIPSTLTTVSYAAFGYCESLSQVTMAEGVQTLEAYAFQSCNNLAGITLPNTLTTIGDAAFTGCYSLEYIEIPDGVTSIGNKAFSPCANLKSMAFFGDAPTFGGDQVFQYATITVSYPRGNSTWTADVRQNYGGNITWIAGCTDSHSFGDWYVYKEPDCVFGGENRRDCGNCKLFFARATEPQHNYVAHTNPPTCTQEGSVYYICSYCGMYQFGETLAPAGHTWETYVYPATCTEDGFTRHFCLVCYSSQVEQEVPALGHDYIVTDSQELTCVQDSYTTYTCTRCDDTYTDHHGEAPGHDYESVVTPPTCTKGGYTTHTCKRCGDSYESDYTSQLYHDYKIVNTPATCTEYGRTTYICQRCDYSYDSVITYPLGHNYVSVVTPPAIGQEGYTTYTCTRCGDSYQDDFTDALMEYHILEGNNGQWSDTEGGSLVFRTDGSAAKFLEIRIDGSVWFTDEYTVTEDPVVITLTPACFSGLSAGEHTLEIVFSNGTATATFTVIRTPKEESWLSWTFSDGTLTVSGCGDMNIHFEAPWVEYKDQITNVVIEEGITTITSAAFMEYPNLATISIPDSVQYIEDHSFYQCPSLTSIVIPDGVTEIGMGTFCGCTSLKTIQIPDSVQSLGYYAFMDCRSLTEIRIPEGVTYIDELLFWGCSSLTTVHMPSTITEIRGSAFTSCSALTDISIPHGVTSIGEMAFTGCMALSNLVFPSTVTYIGEEAFSACYALESITFRGDAPTFDGSKIFYLVFANAYYPKDNPTWTASVRKSYGGSIVWQAIDPCEKGHSYDAVVTEPTCTEGGSTTFTCTLCGDTYVEYTDPLGHSYDTVVTAPTFDSQGYTTYTCTGCGDSYVTDYVPALIRYEILEGDNAHWSDQERTDLVFRANGEIASFTAVRIDGVTIDPSRYTVTEGSTIVTLKADYILRLPNGEHTMEIVFDDGLAIATFTVEKDNLLLGDLNGDGEVDIFDANLVVAYYNGTATLNDDQLTAADVNGDGEVDIFDANLIVSYYNGTIAAFPME